MGGSSVAILPIDGSMGAYLESLERLIGLDRGVTAILPGHGEVIEDPERVLRNYMENRLAREKLVLAALTSNPQSPAEIVPGIYRGLDERLYRAAAATVWAHLRKLGDEGLASSEEPDERDGRWVLTAAAEG
jgi:glyoxylase-like metal-dependent hydrolase (beta-lactamase superfamily II)